MNKVIVLEGNSSERKRALKKIRNSLTDGYNTTIFDNKDSYDHVSNSITEMSCFGEDNLFIVRELPRIEAPTDAQARTKVIGRFKKIFKDIPYGNVLVFDNIGLSANSFLKEVKKFGEVHQFKQKVNKSDGKKAAISYFDHKKMVISEEVAQLLVDSLNLDGDEIDIDKFNLLMHKFYHYVYNKKEVTTKDVHSVCLASKDFVTWTLYKVLDKISASEGKDITPAVVLINDYLNNVKHFQHESVMLIRGMSWRYGLLLLAKQGVNSGMAQKEIVNQISNISKLESKGRAFMMKLSQKMDKDQPKQEYSTGMINSVMSSYYGTAPLTCYSYDQLLLIYYTLVKTVLKVRTGCTDSEIRIAISIVIAVVCGVISKKNTVDGILEHNKMGYGIRGN